MLPCVDVLEDADEDEDAESDEEEIDEAARQADISDKLKNLFGNDNK